MNPSTIDEAQRLLSGLGPTCEYRKAGEEASCSAGATWLLQVSCGDSAFFCQEHHGTIAGELAQRGATLRCAGHGGKLVLYDWVAI